MEYPKPGISGYNNPMKASSVRIFLVFFVLIVFLVLGGEAFILRNNKLLVEKNAVSSIRQASRSFSASFDRGVFPGNENFASLVNTFFGNYGNLLSMTIYSPEGGIYYHRELNKGVLDPRSLEGEHWRGRPEYSFDNPPGLLLVEASPLSYSPGGRTLLMVETAFYTGYTGLNYKIALTLFLVLIAFTIAAIVVLISLRQDSKEQTSPEDVTRDTPEVVRLPAAGGDAPEEEAKKAPEKSLRAQAVPAEKPEEILPAAAQASSGEDSRESSREASPESCIYSEKSGMGRKELMEDKLNQEIKRSASFDQDLVLVIFSLRGLDNPAHMQRFRSLFFESFPYRDLIFDYGDHSFALIIPNTDLESCVGPLENFQLKVEKAGFSPDQKFCAGVSSRCGRLLTAHRLIIEAFNAFKRARKENTGGIILFRISPKKYRQIVAERNFR